jgi:DNA processing protein
VASNVEWYVLSSISGVGPGRIQKLLAAFGSLDEAIAADDLEIIRSQALTETHVEQLRRRLARLEEFEEVLEELSLDGYRLLTLESDLYPPLLRASRQPPPVLYVAGDPAYLSVDSIAVVGARAADPESLAFARTLASALARADWGVVSGLAEGVDVAAHEGCLAAGGVTIAAIGSGFGRVDWSEDLVGDIRRTGAVLSERMMHERATVANLMARNRLVVGLARAVVAVEFGESGGTVEATQVAEREGVPLFLAPRAAEAPFGQGLTAPERARLLPDPEDLGDLLDAARAFIPGTRPRPRDPASADSSGQLRLFGDPEAPVPEL